MKRLEESFSGRGGVNIAYDVWEPDVPSRAILVISHGLGEHGRRYDHVAQRLAALGLTVVVPDHRGHGRSGGPRAGLKRFDDLTDDLQTLFGLVTAERPTQPLFLLGHSMGGTIALHYALDRPDALAGLILSAAAVEPGDAQPKAVLAIAKILGRFAPGLPTAKLDSAGISKDPAVVKAYNEDPLVFTGKVPAGLAGGLLSTMDTFPKRLPGLTVPLLVLHGEADVMTAPSGSKLVIDEAGSADKTLKTYPGLYHEIFNEPEQDQVLDDVAQWLDSHL